MSCLFVRNGRLIDPSQDLDRRANLLVRGTQIEAILDTSAHPPDDAEVVDATDCLIAPGLVDLGTELREPGQEDDETIRSGTAAAVSGGYTTVACSPATTPPIDSQASVEFVRHQAERARHCNVRVLACVSKNRDGNELSEMGLLSQAGAAGFTDGSRPVQNSELMRRALQYTQMLDLPILNQPAVIELNRDGSMHEGSVSTVLGLAGMPAEAEDVMTARDIRLAEATGGQIHLMRVSTSGSIDLLRRARARGVQVTADVAAVNFALSDEALRCFDARFKVNPPLRSQDHLDECIAALRDNTIDAISSGHAPRAAEKKMDVIDAAPFGMAGLETTLGLVGTKLVVPGHLSWPQAISKLSTNPCQILKIANKGLYEGADADLVVINPHETWTVDPAKFFSASSSTPIAGWTLHGRAVHVVVEGKLRLQDRQLVTGS